MYLRNCWYVAGWDHEFPAESLVARTVIEEPIVLYRRAGGEIVALEDRCCHRFAPLSLGRLEGDDVRCMYHGLRFDPSGRCVEIPGQQRIPPQAKVRVYPVVARHSWVWVWMGDPEQADEGLIPGAVGLSDPAWTLKSGQMEIAANYLLESDNLTDLSHLSFVHAKSFGAGPAWIETHPKVTQLGRGVRVERWLLDEPRHPYVPEGPDTTDIWSSYEYLVPGVFLMRTEVHGADPQREAHSPPPESPALFKHFTSQAVTPVNEREVRYYFSWGPSSDTPDAESISTHMLSIAEIAFAEDRAMIEAQQRNVDRVPGAKELLTAADEGPVKMRAVFKNLMEAEARSRPTQSTPPSRE
jgi:vanillate O-demethylase monooxygenase subunit